jgi:hypothetical protein
MKTLPFLIASFALACGSDPTSPPATAGVINVEIIGDPAAFEGRTIEVEGKMAGTPRTRSGFPDQRIVNAGVCTNDRQRFLEAPLHIVVRSSDSILSETTMQRVACRYASDPGSEENNMIVLEKDGTISADFGNDPRTFATCSRPSPRICEKPTF